VFPTYIVYPNLVPTVNLFDALHRDKDVGAQKKRLRFFWYVFIAIFCWEWIPEVRLSPALLVLIVEDESLMNWYARSSSRRPSRASRSSASPSATRPGSPASSAAPTVTRVSACSRSALTGYVELSPAPPVSSAH